VEAKGETVVGVYSVRELAVRLGVSEKFVWKHIQDGKLPGVVRCGRAVRVDKATIERRILGGQVLIAG
jgi:excisionase family DNA binding protein